jgi:hypothetical protein
VCGLATAGFARYDPLALDAARSSDSSSWDRVWRKEGQMHGHVVQGCWENSIKTFPRLPEQVYICEFSVPMIRGIARRHWKETKPHRGCAMLIEDTVQYEVESARPSDYTIEISNILASEMKNLKPPTIQFEYHPH